MILEHHSVLDRMKLDSSTPLGLLCKGRMQAGRPEAIGVIL